MDWPSGRLRGKTLCCNRRTEQLQKRQRQDALLYLEGRAAATIYKLRCIIIGLSKLNFFSQLNDLLGRFVFSQALQKIYKTKSCLFTDLKLFKFNVQHGKLCFMALSTFTF